MPTKKSPQEARQLGPLFTYEGRTDQAIAADALVVPWHLEMREGCLFYRYTAEDVMERLRSPDLAFKDTRDPQRARKFGLPLFKTPSPHVLDGFMHLADADDERILGFARRWGVLDLCEHGLPVSHEVIQTRWDSGKVARCAPLQWRKTEGPPDLLAGREPLELWRSWAGRARALMRIRAALLTFKPGNADDWMSYLGDDGSAPGARADVRYGASVEWDMRLLCSCVNAWMALAQVGPQLVRQQGGSVVIRFGAAAKGGQLFGMIGLQMMARVSGLGSMAICSSCGELYKPNRAPTPSRLNFCPDCGRNAAMRLAKRRMTDLKLTARKLHSTGTPIAEIALAIGRSPSRVRAWVGGKGKRAK